MPREAKSLDREWVAELSITRPLFFSVLRFLRRPSETHVFLDTEPVISPELSPLLTAIKSASSLLPAALMLLSFTVALVLPVILLFEADTPKDAPLPKLKPKVPT